jgi:molybdopterin/thiamine biosynthesis adenylyltransferase
MKIIMCNGGDKSGEIESSYDREIADRHIQVFGEAMQASVSRLNIGIVGAGGLGSILAKLIVRLQPRGLVIADSDVVDKSNLNRLPGATLIDAKSSLPKVNLVARQAYAAHPYLDVKPIYDDFLKLDVQEQFKRCDYVFNTCDRPSPHIASNILCLAHGIEFFDMGTGAVVDNRRLEAAGGQLIRIRPDSGFCLSCSGIYDRKELAEDLMEPSERECQMNLGYIRGANTKAPQVYALNMMVASWATWLFMRTITGEELDFDGIAVDALNFETYSWKEETVSPNKCNVCGSDGIVFRGDAVELLTSDAPSTDRFVDSLKNLDEVPTKKGDHYEQIQPEAD